MEIYSVFSQFYDRFIADVDYQKRAEYFDAIIKGEVGKRGLLLDLACGTGSLSVELSKLGYEVIGVDGSEQMLSIAQNKAFESGEPILFLCQRMEELDLYGTVDACVCALDSLNHIVKPEDFLRALGRVSLFLSPGGVFVFDLNSPYKHFNVLGDNSFVYEEESTVCVWRNETGTDGVTDITLDFFHEAKPGWYERYSERFSERAYSVLDVGEMIKKSALKLLAVYGGDTMEPPEEETERLIFVCKKE